MTVMSKANAILYCRVSTDEQANQGHSLEYQESVLKKFCQVKEYNVVETIREDFSAKSFDRPGWKKLLELVKSTKGMVSKVFFLRWDRFSRNTGDAYEMLRRLQKLGIEAN